MSKVASVVPVASRELVASVPGASVPVQSVTSVMRIASVSNPVRQLALDVGEWRQVGSALSSVLSRVRVLAEASAQFSDAKGSDRSRMH